MTMLAYIWGKIGEQNLLFCGHLLLPKSTYFKARFIEHFFIPLIVSFSYKRAKSDVTDTRRRVGSFEYQQLFVTYALIEK